MNVIQIIGILFGILMIYVTFLYKKRKELNNIESSMWFAAWLAFIGISTFPNALTPIADVFDIMRVMDLLVIFGFMFVIMITFYNYHVVKKMQKKMEDLVRKVAHDNADKKKR